MISPSVHKHNIYHVIMRTQIHNLYSFLLFPPRYILYCLFSQNHIILIQSCCYLHGVEVDVLKLYSYFLYYFLFTTTSETFTSPTKPYRNHDVLAYYSLVFYRHIRITRTSNMIFAIILVCHCFVFAHILLHV